jgi:hypothetical protein
MADRSIQPEPIGEKPHGRGYANWKHGLSKTKEFGIWWTMHQRCENPKAKDYSNYGGRGIGVCERWSDFSVFMADMGPRPSTRHTIERIDTEGDYGPENCCWATQREQHRNRRDNVYLTICGETAVLSDWAKRYGISPRTLSARIRRGVEPREALTAERGSLAPRSSSGIRGVYHHPGRAKPWQVRLRIGGRFRSLGYFATKEEAAAVVRAQSGEN